VGSLALRRRALPSPPPDRFIPALSPFAPSPLQELHHYYEPVRRRTPRRYSIPHGFSRPGHSLSPSPDGTAVSGHAFSRSTQKQPDQARVASMPDTTWPVDGHPPGSSRDSRYIPVSMSPVFLSTRPQRFARARLPDPYLTHQVRLFPHRSRPRSSAKAPVGGLEPPPARRLRRAYLHLSRSTASRNLPTSSSSQRS
jgi:hypothetical protein